MPQLRKLIVGIGNHGPLRKATSQWLQFPHHPALQQPGLPDRPLGAAGFAAGGAAQGTGEAWLPAAWVCLMANHLHLLLQPAQVRDLPRIMQWIGWYSTMALSRLTGRCGHFWEARYFSSPIDPGDTRRVLATLRYIHANPKAASLRKGFHDPYSNYGHYERLEGDVPEVIRSSAGATGQGRSRPANLTGAATAATGWRQWRQGRWPQGSYLCRCNGSSWRRGSGGPMGLGPETGRRSCCCNRCSLSGLWQKTETGIQM